MNPNSKLQLVILAAGQASRLLPLTYEKPKMLLSVGGKPAIFHMLHQAIALGLNDIILVINPSNRKIVETMIGQTFEDSKINIRYIEQQVAEGPGHAFAMCSEMINGSTLLLLSDTLCDLPEKIHYDYDWIGVSKVLPETYSRWCMLEENEEGYISNIIDKPKSKPNTDKAAIGLYYLKDSESLKKALSFAMKANTRINGEIQLSSIFEEYMKTNPIRALEIDSWDDIGTVENYVSTVRKFFTCRYFNSINFKSSGILTKKSTFEGIIDEIDWYNQVEDKSCSILAPRFLGEQKDMSGYSIEFLDYPTLSELFVYNFIPDKTWEFIFSQLLMQVKQLLWNNTMDVSDIEERARHMYIEKTLLRLGS